MFHRELTLCSYQPEKEKRTGKLGSTFHYTHTDKERRNKSLMLEKKKKGEKVTPMIEGTESISRGSWGVEKALERGKVRLTYGTYCESATMTRPLYLKEGQKGISNQDSTAKGKVV